MRRPSPYSDHLWRFLAQCAFWTALCIVAEIVCSKALHLGYPYDWPALPQSTSFIDLSDWIPNFRFYHHLAFLERERKLMYPAPVVFVYKVVCFGSSRAEPPFLAITYRFLLFIFLSGCAMLAGFRAALIRRGLAPNRATAFVVATLALSYPFWFEWSRANMEIVVWLLLTFALYLFCRGRDWGAASLIGIAASMKIFPFVFVGLFLSRRQYRHAAFSFVVAALVTLASLWLLYPDIGVSYREISSGLQTFRDMYMLHIRPAEIGFDHSLFALIKRLFPVLPPPQSLDPILSAYMGISAVAGIVLFFARIRHLPLINQVTCLTICSIVLPPTSYDYTLLHLYAPWAMLTLLCLDLTGRGEKLLHTTAITFTVACYAFLLTPQSEFIFHGERFGGQVKAVVLLALLYTALRYPFVARPSEPPPSAPHLHPQTAAAL